MFKVFVFVGIVAIFKTGSLVFGDTLPCGERENGNHCSTVQQERQPLGKYMKAAVASEHAQCNNVGTTLLSQGGSVVDAAIAVELCVGVLSPHFMGIGGGFMMTVYATPNGETEKKMETLIARETAPAAATRDMFVESKSNGVGGLTIGIPGDVAGLYAAWERYGKLPWDYLVQPAILLAQATRVFPPMNKGIERSWNLMKDFPSIREEFSSAPFTPLQTGDEIKRPELAATLDTIAKEGAKAFYDGSLTADIVAEIQAAGGIITAEDLAGYEPVWREPVSSTVDNGGYQFFGPPPPSSAVIMEFFMNIVDGYNRSPDTVGPERDVMSHQFCEALKFAHAKRTLLGDADFVDVSETIANLTSGPYGDYYRGLINDNSCYPGPEYYGPVYDSVPVDNEKKMDQHTSHISILGEDGSAVSITSTINTLFGSLVRGEKTGIIFNNGMDDFSSPGITNSWQYLPSPMNFIEPGKRPMSSTAPMIVLDKEGHVRLVIGAAGGSYIPSVVAQYLVNNLWMKRQLNTDIAATRLHHQLVPYEAVVEWDMPQSVIDNLLSRGHKVRTLPKGYYVGVAHIIENVCHEQECTDILNCDAKCIRAGTDWRAYGDTKFMKAALPDGY